MQADTEANRPVEVMISQAFLVYLVDSSRIDFDRIPLEEASLQVRFC